MRFYKQRDVWFFEFTWQGKRIRKSTRQGNRESAETIASLFRSDLAEQRFGLEAPKPVVPVNELLDGVQKQYERRARANGETDISNQNSALLRVARRDFGSKMTSEITAKAIEAYQDREQARGKAAATINRRTEVLKHAFLRDGRPFPKFDKLSEEGNAREGFLDATQLDRLTSHLPEDVADFTRFAFVTAMRRSEIASLTWSNVVENEIRLRALDAKIKKARKVIIAGELVPLMERRRAARVFTTTDGIQALSSFIFHRGDGLPIGEFKKSWASACVAAGLGVMRCPKCGAEGAAKWCEGCKRETRYRGQIFHDLRRSGVRRLIRAGVPQSVCMSISGHKGVSTFTRYNITDTKDVENAMLCLQDYDNKTRQASNVAQMTGR